MNAESIAEAVAGFLKGRDDIARAEVQPSPVGPVTVKITTQGGLPYTLTVDAEEADEALS